jgi:methionyl-tRNA formyltransferase
MKIVFLGTPEFAVPSLEALLEAGHDVRAVYTQPDRPKGRGQKLAFSPVKECALRHGLSVHQPGKVRAPEVREELSSFGADLMVVVGYGQIIPQAIIDLPPLGIVNVHGSLLPKYRGAAPIQWAVANGERTTGVTTMQIEAGLDTGPMLLKAEYEIGAEESSLEVGRKLAQLGAGLLIRTLQGLADGAVVPQPQDHALATWAPTLEKAHGLIDWSKTATDVHNRVRGFQPWPGGWTHLRAQRFNIWRCRPSELESPATPGLLFTHSKRLYAACGHGTALELIEVQPEGKKPMEAAAFLNGFRLQPGESLQS